MEVCEYESQVLKEKKKKEKKRRGSVIQVLLLRPEPISTFGDYSDSYGIYISLKMKPPILIPQPFRQIHNRIDRFPPAIEQSSPESRVVVLAFEIESDLLGRAGETCTHKYTYVSQSVMLQDYGIRVCPKRAPRGGEGVA